MNSNDIKLSLIIPCYNEEKNIAPLYDLIKKDLGQFHGRYEMIFVNDGSRDNTRKELKKIHEKKDYTKIIDFSRNFGKEAAIYAGLLEAKGEFISSMDADLQQRPKYVLDMVNFLEENEEYDCVAAFQKRRKESVILRFFKKMFYRVINKMTKITFVQDASDFRTFRRNMADAIIDMKEYFRFSKGIFSWIGFETYYMPYEVEKRANGKTKWSFSKLFHYGVGGIISFSTMPLRFSTVMGMGCSFCSLIYLIVVVLKRLLHGVEIPGYATIVGLILLLGGLELFAIGIMGEYLARTYVETKKRPIFIAREKLSYKEDEGKMS